MNITNLNAHALMNSANAMINTLRNNKKATIKAVVTEWNVCVEQSGNDFLVFNFPVEGWTRKAQVIADLERCAAQLHEMAFAAPVEAEDFTPVDEVEEIEVRDIQVGMWVQNPLVLGQFQQVEEVAHVGNDLVTIRFSWNMGTQTFVYGETLFVRATNGVAQITTVSINEEVNMNNNQATPLTSSLRLLEQVFSEGINPTVNTLIASFLAYSEMSEAEFFTLCSNNRVIAPVSNALITLTNYLSDMYSAHPEQGESILTLTIRVTEASRAVCDANDSEEMGAIEELLTSSHAALNAIRA